MSPYAPEKNPYSDDVHPSPIPFSEPAAAVSSGSSGDITSVKKYPNIIVTDTMMSAVQRIAGESLSFF